MTSETTSPVDPGDAGRSTWWRSLPAQIAVAAVLGILVGTALGDRAADLEFVGTLFIRLIQMVVVLLVASSVIRAMTDRRGQAAGRLGMRYAG